MPKQNAIGVPNGRRGATFLVCLSAGPLARVTLISPPAVCVSCLIFRPDSHSVQTKPTGWLPGMIRRGWGPRQSSLAVPIGPPDREFHPKMIGQIRAVDNKAGALQVLLVLFVSGEIGFSELCRQIRLDRGTVRRAIDRLVTIGAIERSPLGTFPFEKRVRLTAFGRRIANAPLIDWPALFFEHGLTVPAVPKAESDGAPSRTRLRKIEVEILGIPSGALSRSMRGSAQGGPRKQPTQRASRKEPP
jgi:DNA-binding HxlR family transcriptional regulator